MESKKPDPLSAAASAMGKKGGARTLALHGPEHFSKASKARKVFGGWIPKGQATQAKGRQERWRKAMIYKRGEHWYVEVAVHGVRIFGRRWTPLTGAKRCRWRKARALEKFESGLMGASRLAAQPAAQKIN